MRMMLWTLACALAAMVMPATAQAQSTYPTGAAGVKVAGVVPLTCDTSGLNCRPVAQGPSAAAAAGIVPVVTTSDAASALVVCASACNLYGFTAKSTVAGFFIVLNATSAPADGAVTGMLTCIAYPTLGAQATFDAGAAPIRAGTGVTIVFSTTGCYTKTASATATISALAK